MPMLASFGGGSASAFGFGAVKGSGFIISTCYGSPATVNNIVGGPSLTNVNNVSTSSTVPSGTGEINSAFFNGSWLQSTLSSGNAIQGTGDFTLSFYAKRSAVTPVYQRIFSLSNGSIEISVEDYSASLANTITVNTGPLGQLQGISVGNIQDWFRITVLRESGTLKVYVGTSLATTKQGNAATQSNTTNFSAFTDFRVGGNSDPSTWGGLIHKFEFSNKIAVVPT
jgi:hypothetical protein